MKLLLIFALLIIPGMGQAGELENIYKELHSGYPEPGKTSRTYEQTNADTPDVKEVGLERTAGYFLGSPVYTVIIKSNGRFDYVGERNVKHVGKHSGEIPTEDIKPLFQLIREMEYLSLENSYAVPATDQDTVYTMVTTMDRRKVVRNYGKAGPLRLWALEESIDALLSKAHWDDPK